MLRHIQNGFFAHLWMLNGKPVTQGILSRNFRRPYTKTKCYGGLIRNDPYFLPNDVAMAYSCKSTTPFDSIRQYAEKLKLNDHCIQMQALKCPELMKEYVEEMFPLTTSPDFEANPINIINIEYSHPKESDPNDTMQHFILVARELRMDLLGDFWADFINPISGLPFFSEKVKCNKDSRFRGINMTFWKTDACLIIKPNTEYRFTGAVFTTAPLKLLTD